MSALRIGILVCILGVGGCRPCGCMIKRESELNCPTDIRQTVPWCVGEDAVFHCPCGPDDSFYGYKPTCWNDWPAGGAEWRDGQCGPQMPGYSREEMVIQPAELPLLVPDRVEGIGPGMPQTQGIIPEPQSKATWPESSRSDVSLSGQSPAAKAVGPQWPPRAAARIQTLAPPNQSARVALPTRVALVPPRSIDPSKLPGKVRTATIVNAPKPPNRSTVLDRDDLGIALANLNIAADGKSPSTRSAPATFKREITFDPSTRR